MRNIKAFEWSMVLFIALVVIVKVFIDLFVPFSYQNNEIVFSTPTFQKEYGNYTPIDDPEIVETALYYCKGKGFLTSASFDRPSFRKNPLIKTAYRPKFGTYLHIAGIQLYKKVYPHFQLDEKKGMPQNYYDAYGVLLMVLKWLFYIPCLFAFYRILNRLTEKRFALFFTFLWIIYPSSFYVGLWNVFEPIITYLVLLILDLISSGKIEKEKRPWLTMSIGTMGTILCVLLKPHVLITLFLFVAIAFAQALKWKKWTRTLTLSLLFLVASFAAQLPIFVSNYKDFGKVFLSTQSGLAFFQAHNPYARGCWTPELFQKHGKELIQIIAQNKELPLYDEKQEADYYKHLAIQWMMEHPKEELILTVRKVLIFFLPHNFMSLKVNFLTLFTHLGLLVYAFFFIRDKRYRNVEDDYLLSVFAAIFLLNVVYYVEYRWRFFTDPEMLLLAGIGYYNLFKVLQLKWAKGVTNRMDTWHS